MIKLTTLGSGTFFVNKAFSASSFLVEINNTKILIDCGPGTLARLSEAGYTSEDLDYVFITHLHPDHTSDLFPLFMNYRLNDIFSREPITKFPTCFGPRILKRFMLDYSQLSQLPSFKNWDKIEIKPFEKEFELKGIKIKTYPVVHMSFGIDTEAYAIRFEHDGKVLAFSGDTADCEGVREVCKDADLFVCDASYPKSQKKDKIHINTHEIGEISQDSTVKEVVLDHFYPHFSDLDLVAEVKEKFDGKVRKAVDLEVMEI